MTDQPIDQTPPSEPKPKRPYSPQDQTMSDRIADAREKILIVQADPELAERLSLRGFDAARLTVGLDLQVAAQTAFTNRQTAMGEEDAANAAFAAAHAKCRQDYTDFRTTSRKVFKKDAAAQAALGVTGRLTTDAQQLVTNARASYHAALTSPAYLSELSLEGYPQTALQALLAGLDALQAANTRQETARAAAVRATAVRDKADKSLADWRSRFNTAAAIATRDRPDLAAKLGL
jgi:hypothetical protein